MYFITTPFIARAAIDFWPTRGLPSALRGHINSFPPFARILSRMILSSSQREAREGGLSGRSAAPTLDLAMAGQQPCRCLVTPILDGSDCTSYISYSIINRFYKSNSFHGPAHV